MSKIKGGVAMAGFICPSDSTDTYPTHKAEYGKGGYRSVTTIAERDAIPEDRRSPGMQVYVMDTGEAYTLGVDNVWSVPSNTDGNYKIFASKAEMDSYGRSTPPENGVLAYSKDNMYTYMWHDNQWNQQFSLGGQSTPIVRVEGGAVSSEEFKQLSGVATSFTIQEQIDRGLKYKPKKEGWFSRFKIEGGHIADVEEKLANSDVISIDAGKIITGTLNKDRLPTYGLDRSAFTYGEFDAAVIPPSRNQREMVGSDRAPFTNAIQTMLSGCTDGIKDDQRRDYFWYMANSDGEHVYSIDTDGWYHRASDERLKKNINTIENVLEKYEKIRGVTYEWKKSPGSTQYGVIAQEVKEVFPALVEQETDEAVIKDKQQAGDGYMSVNYEGFHGTNIQAIKELKALVDEQDKRMDAQDAEIAELIAKLKDK